MLERMGGLKLPAFGPAARATAAAVPKPPDAPAGPSGWIHELSSKAGQLFSPEYGTWEALRGQDLFGEEDTLPAPTLQQLQHWGPMVQRQLKSSDGLLFSGRLGWLTAARFVPADSRNDFDFRYACGERTFRDQMRSVAYLDSIPQGQFPARLRELTERGTSALLEKVFRLSGGSDPALAPGGANVRAALEQAAAGLEDPGSDVVEVAARAELALAAAGAPEQGWGPLARALTARILAERDLPPPILADHQVSAALCVAAYRAQLMAGIQRTLMHLGYQNLLALPEPLPWPVPFPWIDSVSYREYWTRDFGAPTWAKTQFPGTFPRFSPAGPSRISLAGMPYALGPDGFVYNMMGRPHWVDEQGGLQPLPMLNYYCLIRRLAQARDPGGALAAFTARTRAWYDPLAANPQRASEQAAPEDRAAMEADNRYQLGFGGLASRQLLEVFDPDRSSPQLLFAPKPPNTFAGTAASFTLSRYTQLDLEYWGAEQALRAAGDVGGAVLLRYYRAKLFGLARKYLLEVTPNPDFRSSRNPFGLQYDFERRMLERSPLQYRTLEQAIEAQGDDHVYVWRGTLAADRLLGLQPEHSPLRPDTVQLEAMRARQHGAGNLLRSIEHGNGSPDGTGALCATSDVGMEIVGSWNFAAGEQFITVPLSALPPGLAQLADRLLPEGKDLHIGSVQDALRGLAGHPATRSATQLDLRGASLEEVQLMIRRLAPPNQERILERVQAALAGRRYATPAERLLAYLDDAPLDVELGDLVQDDWTVQELQMQLDHARDVVVVNRSGDGLSLGFPNRMLLIKVPKAGGLPGLDTVAGEFLPEQEVTLIRREGPWRVVAALPTDQLKVEAFPRVSGSSAPGRG